MSMVLVTEVDDGITGPEFDESIKSMATNENILYVAMSLPNDALGSAMDVAKKMDEIIKGAKEGSF